MNFDKTKAQAFTRGARWQRADQFNNLPVPSTGSLREIFALTISSRFSVGWPTFSRKTLIREALACTQR